MPVGLGALKSARAISFRSHLLSRCVTILNRAIYIEINLHFSSHKSRILSFSLHLCSRFIFPTFDHQSLLKISCIIIFNNSADRWLQCTVMSGKLTAKSRITARSAPLRFAVRRIPSDQIKSANDKIKPQICRSARRASNRCSEKEFV